MTVATLAKPASSDAKRASNRANAQKSTGPKTDAGKGRSRLNALKHGLRSEDLVLPTEDADAFDDFRQAWHDDWKPCTQARFQLVETLVAATWRMKRCQRVETLRLGRQCRQAVADYGAEVEARVAEGVRLLGTANSRAGLRLLDTDREGVERQVDLWLDLAGVLGSPEAWREPRGHHGLLMSLHGHEPYAPAEDAGEVGVASWRLLTRNDPSQGEYTGGPLGGTEAKAITQALAGYVEGRVRDLRERLSRLPSAESIRARISDLAIGDDSPEGRQAMRYEAQHDRTFRAALGQLIKLMETGADLVEEPTPQAAPATQPAPDPTPVPIEANELAPAASPPIKATAPSRPRRSRARSHPAQPANPPQTDQDESLKQRRSLI
jgi:hypothetical protein